MAEEAIYLVRILYAVALGFAIGFERKLRFKEAGIRTHTIVCAGSALIMVVSKYALVLCTGTVTTTKDVSATMIAELLTEHDFIRSIERCDDE